MANVDWSKALSREQADALEYPDFTDDAPREVWPNRRSNQTSGFGTLHVVDLNKIKSGSQRRMYAVYGVPVGWGTKDGTAEEFMARFEELDAARDEGDEAYAVKLDAYGLLDADHYEWIRNRIENSEVWNSVKHAEAQQVIDQTTARLKDEMKARMEGELKGELAPVEGVTLQQWAWVQAKLAGAQPLEGLLATAKMDKPKWDRVSAEWNARMSRDTTATIATAYGQAFTASGDGPFAEAGKATAAAMLDSKNKGGAGAEPIPFEKWIEITEAQNAASARGLDAIAVLKSYGLTPAQWGTAGGFWSQKFTANAMTMIADYNALSAKYREKFAAQGKGGGITF